jgi:hypothetical protein
MRAIASSATKEQSEASSASIMTRLPNSESRDPMYRDARPDRRIQQVDMPVQSSPDPRRRLIFTHLKDASGSFGLGTDAPRATKALASVASAK